MANNTYKQHLENLLKQDARFVDDEGELMGNKVKSFTDDLDEKLIELLLQDERSRTQFFIKIKEVYVFKASEFKFFLEQNKIDNSFTNYINQIGLSVGGKFLKDNTDVVLDFPYKDCILEGGQSTEEGLDTYFEYDEEVSKTDEKKGYKPQQYNEKQTKRKEIFFNNIVAKDEIDRLLEPKAFANITKYDVKGESKPKSFTRDAAINKKRNLPADTITDNLIIKGNNLLALESLKEEFKGKVKLIYIDPPYNTGSDSFAYNDNFNHSTWLTFMYNRLEVAKELLSEEGLIYVQCDDNEQSYLKIILDNIFKDGFINNIVAEMSNLSGNKIEHAIQGRKFPKIKEYILLYCKSKSNYKLQIPKQEKENWDDEYNMIIPSLSLDGYKEIKELISINDLSNLNKVLFNFKLESLKKYAKDNKIDLTDEWKFENSFRILASKPNTALRKKALTKEYNQIIYALKNQRGDLKIIKTDFNRDTDTARIELVFAEDNSKVFFGDIWFNIVTTGGVAQEGGVVLKNGKKPEYLLHKIISSATNENDIVLDYHLGSGTTAAVSMKMNRQFIGLEQIDSQVEMSKTRLQNVINKDNSGISRYKDVNWQGGGSFTYLELAKNNQNAKDQILACNSYKELMELFNDLYSKYFLHYNLKTKEFQEVVAKEEKFIALSLDRQKEIFCKMLDNNQLYVNVSEMEDSKHNISPEDIALTKDFYQIKE
ncbi:site-specific DNA-methyltransferase [Bizionia hallyeonensis]|uniref:site-specific DNA-methyltransferase (adenine-specific) n=1 Tax=Bizionia hallyeonensis TaxID=1123757 RepID=A0ABW0CAG3_9FLAO